MWENFRLRLYLETTTFNWYFDERPGHEDVVRLFEAIRDGKFVGYTSKYVTDELDKAKEPKRNAMLSLIDKYGIILLDPKLEVDVLAEEYRNSGIIPHSQKQDSRHIAAASLYELDGIVSYNFHHINRGKTKALIPKVNSRRDLGGIMFFTAKEVFDYYEQFFRGR